MSNKEKIIELFHNNVKGKKADISGANTKHDGKIGHWLERQFGITPNGSNEPDLFGYELKNETSSKTTFGDWSANRYIFKTGDYAQYFVGNIFAKRQDSFCSIFGKPNESKDNIYSWSGSPCPTIHGFNDFGMKLVNTKDKDKRPNKGLIVPVPL